MEHLFYILTYGSSTEGVKDTEKKIPLTHKYMASHITVLVHTLLVVYKDVVVIQVKDQS
jgi:hypothetical protein